MVRPNKKYTIMDISMAMYDTSATIENILDRKIEEIADENGKVDPDVLMHCFTEFVLEWIPRHIENVKKTKEQKNA